MVRLIWCDGQRIDLERYEKRAERHWVSVNTSNDVARALYDDRLENPGLHESTEVLGGATAAQLRDALPVDAVCTWVNHDDRAWKELYSNHIKGFTGTSDAAAMTRFTHNDELRFVLRSLAQNLPWLRRIHVVSNCAPPEWLETGCEAIAWVDHSDILPPEALPSFNSHAIETALQMIPGLSEHFIYTNDDMFVCRPQKKAQFFTPYGCSLAVLEPYSMAIGDAEDGAPDYLNAARVSARLICETFGSVPTRLHAHVPYALRKSVLENIVAYFPEAIARTRSNKFRGSGDVNLASFLYHHFALLKGQAQESQAEAVFVRSSDLRWLHYTESLSNNGCDFLCLNEGGQLLAGRDWNRRTARTLKRLFPDPAPWERL